MSTTPTPTLRRLLASGLVAAGLLASGLLAIGALPAGAQDVPADEPALVTDRCVPDRLLEEARTRILRGIDARLTRLDRIAAATAAAGALTDAHESTITDKVASTRSGLTALRATVETETDGCALGDEGRAVVEDYRVYLVLTPQSRLTIGADRVAATEPRLATIEQHLSDAIDAAEAAGQDVTEARADFATYQAEAAAAVATSQPIGDSVLALVPQDWPDPAHGTLDAARTDLRAAVDHLRAARAAAAEVRDDLT